MQEQPDTFNWLVELGVRHDDLHALNPCVPGEFTLPDTLYVNTATPRLVYHGSAEGTLPLVTGRWYIIPNSVVKRVPSLSRDTRPIAIAVRHAR
jgi:hypothetical protein